MPGEGSWTVNPGTGKITFTPSAGFSGQTKPVGYTVQDANGTTTQAKIIVTVRTVLPITGTDLAMMGLLTLFGICLLGTGAFWVIRRRRHG